MCGTNGYSPLKIYGKVVAMLCKVRQMFYLASWQRQDYENSFSALVHFSIDFNGFLPHILVCGFARQNRAGAL
jgi:hypothetical protein